jgi:phosphoserine phosphatase
LFTATLIAKEGLSGILNEVADRFEADFGRFGRLTSVEWIEQDVALDLTFAPAAELSFDDRSILADALRENEVALDVLVQPVEHRSKRLLVADMDSTMITVECIDELADFAGLKTEVAAVTEAAMRGELDFEAALDARVALLEGMDESMIDRCRQERVRPTPGARELVRTMRERGGYCLLVSGGFTRFAEPVADLIGFDRAMANVLIVEDGRLTGLVRRPVVGAEAKREALLAAAAELGIGVEEALAVGDGANDLPMIRAAGLGIAYHAKPVLAEAADARIDHNDLTALLYAQGIPRSEWVQD